MDSRGPHVLHGCGVSTSLKTHEGMRLRLVRADLVRVKPTVRRVLGDQESVARNYERSGDDEVAQSRHHRLKALQWYRSTPTSENNVNHPLLDLL